MQIMRRFSRVLMIFLGLLLLTVGTSAAFSHAQDVDFEVRIKGASLSVDVVQVQLGRLMEEISRQAGFELSISPELRGKTVNTSFAGMELEDGIRRILGLVNLKSYIMEYAKDGSLSKLDVFKGGTGVTSSTVPSHAAPSIDRRAAVPLTPTGITKIVPGRRPTAPVTRRHLLPERVRPDRHNTARKHTSAVKVLGESDAPAPDMGESKDKEPMPPMPEGSADMPPPLMPEDAMGEPPPFMPEGTPGEPPPFMPEGTPGEPPPFMPEGTPDEPPPLMPGEQ